MIVSIPVQADKNSQAIMAATKKAVGDAKTVMLFVMMVGQVLLNSFLNSLAFLGFMAIELGVNMSYPPVAITFFGALLGLINFDLLSEWSFFDVPYEPEQSMAEPLNQNFGYIGFETCSITLSLGSLVWFIVLWVIQLLFLAVNTDFIIRNVYMNKKHWLLRRIGAKIAEKRKALFWNGFL